MKVLKVDYLADDAAQQFSKSLRETGFAVIENHNISKDLVTKVYAQWQEFFESERKLDFPYDNAAQDGYFPKGTEVAKGYSIGDLKEFYHIYPKGRIPEELKEATFELREQMYKMAKRLLDMIESELPTGIAQSLDMPLSHMVSNDRTLFRTIYYPAFDGTEEKGAIRAAAHGDINLITLLPAASADGLQVQDINDNWHDVPCDFGNISINAGDMLDMATKGYYPSTVHRVINPNESKQSTPRLAVPLFLHPKADVQVEPGFTAEQYLNQRLQEIGIREVKEEAVAG